MHDRDTALVRFGHRDYDPDTGRWTAKDPIGPLSGDLNLYEYCAGDPVNLADPSGLLTFDDVLYHAANFSAGVGDSLAFGATQLFREWQMGGDVVNTSSGAYKIGVGVETVAEFASGLGAVFKTGVKQASRSAVKTAVRGACFVEGTEVSTATGFVPIEDLEVGDRVLTTDETASVTDVDPVNWRTVELQIPDATGAVTAFTVSVLRPLSWLQEVGADVDRSIQFELPEMGVRGQATVLSISGCPAIKPGPGRVVLATVQSESDTVVELNADGLDTPVCATPPHLFYSVDRSAWVPAAALIPGERLKTDNDSIQLTQTKQLPGHYTVYNLEVETDHDYFVTEHEILAHNVNPCAASLDDVAAAAKRAGEVVGPGSGHVHGTNVHKAFADEIEALGKADLSAEVSYLNGKVVKYGKSDSIRVDAVLGPKDAPTSVFDLKTGGARLSSARIRQIQAHLPVGTPAVRTVRP